MGPSGPGGIRTLDLFSAIEARSQLRYRPPVMGPRILNEPIRPVKQLDSCGRAWPPVRPRRQICREALRGTSGKLASTSQRIVLRTAVVCGPA